MRSIVVAVGLVFSASAYAQCPIRDFKDEINYHRDILTNLSYFDQISSHFNRNDASSQNLQFLDIASMNSDQASSLSSSLQRILEIQWTQRDQETLLVSELKANGLKGYRECLETNRLSLWLKLGEGAGGKQQFLVDMYWRPFYPAPDPSKVVYHILNGKVLDGPKTIRSGQDHFTVKREDMFKPLEIGVKVDTQIYPNISLPALPQKKMNLEERENSEPHDVYGGGVDYVTTLCVKIPNEEQDAVIVPNTLEFSTTGVVADRASLTELPNTRRVDSRSACTGVRWGLSANDGRVYGTAHVKAKVIKAVPVARPTAATRDVPLFEGQGPAPEGGARLQ